MKKTCLKIATIFLVTLFSFSQVHAATLTLDNIGALSTGGSKYSEWWYTGTTPILRGTADPNATVSVSVNGAASTVTADASGAWSYQANLETGDYNMVLSSGDQSYSFVLHAGQMMDSNASGTTTETNQTTTPVPETGASQVAGLLISMSLMALGYHFFVLRRKSSKKAYVKTVLDSLD